MPRYELVEGASNKFWDSKLAGSPLTTTFGKIGSQGQTPLKPRPKQSTSPRPHRRWRCHRAGRDGARHVLRILEGNSSKFWEIAIDGTTVATRYRRSAAPARRCRKCTTPP